MRNRHGVTLLEVIVASLLLGILVMGFMGLQRNLFKGTQTVLKQGAMVRALALVREDLVRNDRFLPPQEIPSKADPRDPRSFDSYLDDPEISGLKCYTEYGSEVSDCTDPDKVFFRVRYAKFRQPDLSYYDNDDNPEAKPENEFNRIPLAFYRVRVEFSPDGKSKQTLFFSQYQTSVVIY